jgi:hypothetical protein
VHPQDLLFTANRKYFRAVTVQFPYWISLRKIFLQWHTFAVNHQPICLQLYRVHEIETQEPTEMH